MSCLLDLFFEYWQIIIPCLFGLVEFVILLIFKKRPRIIDPTMSSDIVNLINEAEEKYGAGHGKEKLVYVVKKLAFMRGMSEVVCMVCYRSFIERVLETPQKKGGIE